MYVPTQKPNDRQELYDLLVAQVDSVIHDEDDEIANYANISAIIMDLVEGLNWVGFYLYKQGELVLGPFQGKLACTRIKVGAGVCGTAFQTKTVQNVPDVHQFEGHIACDGASNSELVIPIVVQGEAIGVLDIDSFHYQRFDELEEKAFQAIVSLIEKKLENK
jgi:L-methionine (R)-S-oxide reductase